MTGAPLAVARRHYRQAAKLTEPVAAHGSRWEAGRARLGAAIDGIAAVQEGIHLAQRQWLFDHRLAVAAVDVQRSHAALALQFPQFARQVASFADSPLSLPETVIASGDLYPGQDLPPALHSNTAAFHAGDILFAAAHLPRTDALCEIGAGHGAAARLWLRNPVRRPRLYILLDFPESLFFAELFLRLELPEAEHRYLLSAADATGLAEAGADRRPVIAYLPVALATAIADLPLDAVLNSAGFQEFGPDWLAFYRDLLDGMRCDRLVSHNLCLAPVGHVPDRVNPFAPLLGPRWRPGTIHVQPPLDVVQSIRFAAQILFLRHDTEPGDLFGRLLHGAAETGFDHAALIRLLYLVPAEAPDDWLHRFVYDGLRFLGYLPTEILFLLQRHRDRAAAGGRSLSPGLQQVLDSLQADAARMQEAADAARAQDGPPAG